MLYKALAIICFAIPIVEFLHQLKDNFKWHSLLVFLVPITFSILLGPNVLDLTIGFGNINYNFNVLFPCVLTDSVAIIYISIIYKQKPFKKLLSSVLLYVFIDLLVKLVYSAVTEGNFNYYNDFYNNTQEKQFFAFTYFTEIVIMTFLSSSVYPSKKIKPVLKIFVSAMLSSMGLIFPLTQSYLEKEVQNYSTSTIYVIFLVVLLIYFFMVAITLSANTVRDKATSKYYQIKNNLENFYSKQMVLNQDELIKLKHDINNFLQVVKLKDEKLYKQLSKKIGTSNKFNFTVDDTLNKILVIKLNDADEAGVKFDLDIFVKETIEIDDMDKISLFTNIIDNAINAAKDSKEKSVLVEVYYTDRMLNIHINNSCDHMVRKADDVYHGKGRIIVNSIVNKYGGNINSVYANNIYNLNIDCDLLKTKAEEEKEEEEEEEN